MLGRTLVVAALVFLSCLTPASWALAHAYLVRAEPGVGARVAAAPASVRIEFSERIEAAFSWIHVVDGAGARADKGDVRLESSEGTALAVSLGALAPGVYRVFWHVVSLDTHVTEGDFKFELAASTP